jgi:hypothetical protein
MNIVEYVDLALQRGQILDLLSLYGTNKEIYDLLNNSDKLRYLSAIVGEPVTSFRNFVIKYMENLIDNLNIDKLVILANLYFGDPFAASFLDSQYILNKLKEKFQSLFNNFYSVTREHEVYNFNTFAEFIIYYLLIEIEKRAQTSEFINLVNTSIVENDPESIVLYDLLSSYNQAIPEWLDDRATILVSNEETNRHKWQELSHALDSELSELQKIVDKYLLEIINAQKFSTYISLIRSFDQDYTHINYYFLHHPDIPLPILAEILYILYTPKTILDESIKTHDVQMINYMVDNFEDFRLNYDEEYRFYGVSGIDDDVDKGLFEMSLSLETILKLYNIIKKKVLEMAIEYFGTRAVIETLKDLGSVELLVDDNMLQFIFEPLNMELLTYISNTDKIYISDDIDTNILYAKLSELVKHNDISAVKQLTKFISKVFPSDDLPPSESVLRNLLQTVIINAIENDDTNIIRWLLEHFQQREFYIRINDLLQNGIIKAQTKNKIKVVNIIQNYLHDKM